MSARPAAPKGARTAGEAEGSHVRGMKYVDEFRDGALAQQIGARIRAEAQPGREYRFMEFCGGHTHAIARYGVAELLPAANTIIFDEAHQLPETASLFFGQTVSTAQLIELARDTRIEAVASAKEVTALPEATQALDKAARDLRLAFREEAGRFPYASLTRVREFVPALDHAAAKLDALSDVLAAQASRSEGLENCWQRAQTLLQQLNRWQEGVIASNKIGRASCRERV